MVAADQPWTADDQSSLKSVLLGHPPQRERRSSRVPMEFPCRLLVPLLMVCYNTKEVIYCGAQNSVHLPIYHAMIHEILM
jgi:hypothetical protein